MRTSSITVKLPVPVYEMLKDEKTKYKMTTDQFVTKLIKESYKSGNR